MEEYLKGSTDRFYQLSCASTGGVNVPFLDAKVECLPIAGSVRVTGTVLHMFNMVP